MHVCICVLYIYMYVHIYTYGIYTHIHMVTYSNKHHSGRWCIYTYTYMCVYMYISVYQSVQSLSCVWLGYPMDCSTPDFSVHHQLPEPDQTHVLHVSDAIQPPHPLSSPSSPSFSLSQHQGLFQWVSSSHQVVKVLEFQLQHQSFQWIFRTDFFRMDWLDLLAVQGTLKSLLQHHSSKAAILWCSAFFIIQLSHLYMTTGKNHSFD